jgi:hypothetical protein
MLEKLIEALILNTKFGKQYMKDVSYKATARQTHYYNDFIKRMRDHFTKEINGLKQQVDTMEREYDNLEESFHITEQDLAATTYSYDYTSDCLANKSKELLATQDELNRANEAIRRMTAEYTDLSRLLSYNKYLLERAGKEVFNYNSEQPSLSKTMFNNLAEWIKSIMKIELRYDYASGVHTVISHPQDFIIATRVHDKVMQETGGTAWNTPVGQMARNNILTEKHLHQVTSQILNGGYQGKKCNGSTDSEPNVNSYTKHYTSGEKTPVLPY